MHLLLIISFCLSLCSSVLSAAVIHPCSSVYRGFAECLVTLGDSVSSKTDNPQDINSICKSWDAFQVCVSGVLLSCRGDAAEIWESLRAESRKTAFAGNLYDMCASRTEAATATTPLVPNTDQTNQETLKGLAHSVSKELLLICLSLLLLLWM
ncbi:neuritin-like protein [Carassius auratus]|uniref:Neuritin-like protein n=1 Tax=Carassius auratus TaxID=7957 RepID=A0A6P6KN49_CARAU|nr:neuritin-like protein [Carassius auratus]XP_052458021.1 neuritin-like protein [Carassius gibelio]